MRARGLCLLRAFHERGAVTWEEGVPALSVPDDPELTRTVHEDLQTIRAVLRRAVAFRRQLLTRSAEPFLRYRAPKWTAEGCPSCGGKVAEHEFLRCGLCALAAELALAAPAQAQQPAQEEQVA